MGFFEEAVLSAKDAANTAGKKVESVYNARKRKFSIAELKRKLKSKYAELGVLAYNTSKNEVDNAVAAELIIQEIDCLITEIKTAEELDEKMKNSEVCPACSFANPKGFCFCGKCGASMK